MREKTRHQRQQKKLSSLPRISAFTCSLFLLSGAIVTPFVGNIHPVQAEDGSAGVQKGRALLNKGLVNDAITAFQQALKSQPQSLQGRLGLAIAYRRAGRIAEAWSAYQQVLAIDPNNQLALRTIGLLGTYRPEWNQQGIAALTTLLNLNPNDLEGRGYRALLYSYQGQLSASLADYQIVLGNNPTPEVILGAAQAYSYNGDFSQALQLFNRYQSSGKPILNYGAVAYGRTLRETGNPAAAIQVLEAQLQRSTTLDEIAIETRKELAIAYLANQQQTKALAVLDPLQGRPDAVLALARSLNEIRKVNNNPTLAKQVVTLYRQALAAEPNPSTALLREVADVFTAFPEGRPAALQLYRQAVAKSPNDQSLVVRQLALENRLGTLSKKDFRQRLVAILQPLPRDPVKLKQLADALTTIDVPEPEFLPVYQNILQTGVNAPFLYFRVAQIHVQRHDLNAARRSLAAYTATPRGAKDLATQLLAAEIERREGTLEASAQRYQAILRSKPDSEITNAALRGLAGVKLQQRRFDEALAVYDQLLARSPQDAVTQLGRTSIAYQAKRISLAAAEAVLQNWLATQPATNTPTELYSLVAALPTDPQRAALYNYLVQVDPNSIPLQVRLVQVLAKRNPAQAQARMKQLLARIPKNSDAYQLQAELARSVGNLELASSVYEKILAQQPDNIDALAALGGIRFEQRRFDSAQEIYTQVLAQKPDDQEARRALAGLSAILDQPLAALSQLEKLQLEGGTIDSETYRQMQQIQEDFLIRRGFQPPWEDYQRRNRN